LVQTFEKHKFNGKAVRMSQKISAEDRRQILINYAIDVQKQWVKDYLQWERELQFKPPSVVTATRILERFTSSNKPISDSGERQKIEKEMKSVVKEHKLKKN